MKSPQVFGRFADQGHLTDEQLVAVWQDRERSPHLEACESCRTRAGELGAFLDAVRSSAIAEADRVFTPERLATQQAHVLRRLERGLRPAHVIAFPAVRRRMPVVRLVARRWVALAAAAGLLLGLIAGLAVDRRSGRPGAPVSGLASGAVARLADAGSERIDPAALERALFNDEAFLRDLEFAVTSPHVEELQALDALTPHVREVSTTLIR